MTDDVGPVLADATPEREATREPGTPMDVAGEAVAAEDLEKAIPVLVAEYGVLAGLEVRERAVVAAQGDVHPEAAGFPLMCRRS